MSPRLLAWLSAGVAAAVLIAALAWALAHPAAPPAPEPGQPAPDVAVQRLDGAGLVRLSELRGRPVVLNFWASWCASCQAEAGVLGTAARERAGAVAFLGVDVRDTAASGLEYLRREGVPYPVGEPVGDGVARYGVSSPPVTVFVDAEGLIAARYAGPLTPSLLDRYLQIAGAR